MKILQYATKENKKMFKDIPVGAYFTMENNKDITYVKLCEHKIISNNTQECAFNVIDGNGNLSLIEDEEIVIHLTGLSIIEL